MTVRLTLHQRALLAQIHNAGAKGLLWSGRIARTAAALRQKGLIGARFGRWRKRPDGRRHRPYYLVLRKPFG